MLYKQKLYSLVAIESPEEVANVPDHQISSELSKYGVLASQLGSKKAVSIF